MVRNLVAAAIATWATLLGVMLPYILIPGIGRLVNIPWGVTYGLGLLFTDTVAGNSLTAWYIIVGLLVWPTVVVIGLYLLGASFWNRLSAASRATVIALMFISTFVNGGLHGLTRPPLNALPTYWQLMFAIW